MKEKIIEFCSKIKIEKLFLLVAIPLSLMYALLVLPLNVPDEGTHLIKAYDISIGHIVTQIDEEGKSYAIIPRELENYSYMRFQNYKDVFNELQRTTDYKDQVRTVCAAQGNSPFLYVGSVMGFLIGRIFGINLFYVVYLSRIINIVIYLVFGYLTIKKVPFGKLVMVIYLCMPMMLQQAASCSADAILNATLIYYIAHLLYLTFKETEPPPERNIGMGTVSTGGSSRNRYPKGTYTLFANSSNCLKVGFRSSLIHLLKAGFFWAYSSTDSPYRVTAHVNISFFMSSLSGFIMYLYRNFRYSNRAYIYYALQN